MTSSRRDFLRLYETGALPLAAVAAGMFSSSEARAQQLPEAGDGEMIDAAAFGVKADGKEDDTAAWEDLLGQAQATKRPIRYSAGRYFGRSLVREGVLKWTFANSVAMPFPGPLGPVMMTSGNPAFIAADKDDAPILQIHNDPRPVLPSGGIRTVTGGYIGPLSFEDRGVGASQRHGISLFGVNLMHFGMMQAVNGLGGDVFHIGTMGDAVTADAWNVSGCLFDGVLCQRINGWAFNCEGVSQSFSHNRIGYLAAYHSKGAFRGGGAMNFLERVTAHNCSEWALDLSTDIGLVQGFDVGYVEADANRNGLRVRGINNLRIGAFRNIYRRVGEEIWPLKGAVFGDGGKGRQVRDAEVQLYHRFADMAEQVNKPDMLDFTDDPHNSNIHVAIRTGVATNDQLAEPFIAGIHRSARDILVTQEGQPLHDSRRNNRLVVRSSKGQASANYGTPLELDAVYLDEARAWDGKANEWLCPATGTYRVHAQVEYQAPPLALVRLGLFVNGIRQPLRESRGYAPAGAAESQTYSLEAVHKFERGDRLRLSLNEASENTVSGGSVGAINANFLEIGPA